MVERSAPETVWRSAVRNYRPAGPGPTTSGRGIRLEVALQEPCAWGKVSAARPG